MTNEILMPALSPTMEEGTLLKWHVGIGDKVASGDIIAEIETDKATMEFESIEDGTITDILIAEGTQGVKVNEVLAILSIEEELNIDAKNVSKSLGESARSKEIEKAPDTKFIEKKVDSLNKEERIKISPLAKKIANLEKIDYMGIKGSGPNGRIIKNDVMKFVELEKSSNLEPSHDSSEQIKDFTEAKTISDSTGTDIKAIFSNRKFTIEPITKMRKIIAERLTISKQTIPHFYLRRTINLDKLLIIRAEINDVLKTREVKLTLNDFIIKASAKALQDNPKCNSIWAEQEILRLKPSDIAIAVALDEGLITPVIKDAESKSLKEISHEMKALALRAKEKKLLPHEYVGGSFAISNLGMMGIENFDAVINPPQASILAVGACIKKPNVNNNNEITSVNSMSVTLSVDHRVIDGATGAKFLDSIAQYLEKPVSLLL